MHIEGCKMAKPHIDDEEIYTVDDIAKILQEYYPHVLKQHTKFHKYPDRAVMVFVDNGLLELNATNNTGEYAFPKDLKRFLRWCEFQSIDPSKYEQPNIAGNYQALSEDSIRPYNYIEEIISERWARFFLPHEILDSREYCFKKLDSVMKMGLVILDSYEDEDTQYRYVKPNLDGYITDGCCNFTNEQITGDDVKRAEIIWGFRKPLGTATANDVIHPQPLVEPFDDEFDGFFFNMLMWDSIDFWYIDKKKGDNTVYDREVKIVFDSWDNLLKRFSNIYDGTGFSEELCNFIQNISRKADSYYKTETGSDLRKLTIKLTNSLGEYLSSDCIERIKNPKRNTDDELVVDYSKYSDDPDEFIDLVQLSLVLEKRYVDTLGSIYIDYLLRQHNKGLKFYFHDLGMGGVLCYQTNKEENGEVSPKDHFIPYQSNKNSKDSIFISGDWAKKTPTDIEQKRNSPNAITVTSGKIQVNGKWLRFRGTKPFSRCKWIDARCTEVYVNRSEADVYFHNLLNGSGGTKQSKFKVYTIEELRSSKGYKALAEGKIDKKTNKLKKGQRREEVECFFNFVNDEGLDIKKMGRWENTKGEILTKGYIFDRCSNCFICGKGRFERVVWKVIKDVFETMYKK